ncbi:MAG: FAD-dependent oxidoreductase [Candidatus Sumerlaeaceae bacterium]|nr:FAD-dependent oxidoreductase [Candidatus Sumerlaeaceae bacterium]
MGNTTTDTKEILIIGAGLAGLCCARHLYESGFSPIIIEASDGVGGRVRTDNVEGFLLDRGFQVLLTAYPEAKRMLDYGALNLRPFFPGALVHYRGQFCKLSDPFRQPREAITTLMSPVGSVFDKFCIAKLRKRACAGPLSDLFQRRETTTLQALRAYGFSEGMIDGFFRPYLGGVMLDRDLNASSRMFEFVFRMFAQGDTVVPAEGMGAIPKQLAARLPADTIRTGVRVAALADRGVVLENGESLQGAAAVVIATDGREAARILGQPEPPPGRGVTCLYFAADGPPIKEPMLMLDGDGSGPVNNICVISQVAPSYAPVNQSLVSASVIGIPQKSDADLEDVVRGQMASWFGPDVYKWRHLRTYRISNALPDQSPPALEPAERPVTVREGVYVCGDHRDTASIQGAMVSGRRAAEALLKDLQE